MTYAEETQEILVLMVKYLSALQDWTEARQSVLTPDEWGVILAATRPMRDLGYLLESGKVIPGVSARVKDLDTLYELMTNDTPQRYSSDILGQY